MEKSILQLTESLLAVTERLKEHVYSNVKDEDWFNAWVINNKYKNNKTYKDDWSWSISTFMETYLLLTAISRELKRLIADMKNLPEGVDEHDVFVEKCGKFNFWDNLELGDDHYDQTLVTEFYNAVYNLEEEL